MATLLLLTFALDSYKGENFLFRLLAAIEYKKEVDAECWNKAREMEAKRRVGLAELLR